jgi:hypothetical protein
MPTVMRCRTPAGPLLLALVAVWPLGCKKEAAPDPGAATTAAPSAAPTASIDFSPTGLKACDDYFAAVRACLPKVDEHTRDSFGQEVSQYRSQIAGAGSEAAKNAIAIGCDAAREGLADEGCK